MDVLLNWLWQGVVVALAAAALLRVIPQSRTQARYRTVWAACVVVLALPLVPLALETASPVPVADRFPVSVAPIVVMPDAWWTSAALVVGLWIVWSGASVVRFVGAGFALLDARSRCQDCPQEVERRLQHWSRVKDTGRRTRLVLSPRVRAAAVLGHGSPIIAIAPSLLEHLGDADLDRVVMHEWAHVQRRDDIAQYVQLLVHVVAGWHPALWWLGRQMELEREVACDEIAVSHTGAPKGYAACLVTLVDLPGGPARPLPALAVSSSGLRRRLVRILAGPGMAVERPSLAIAVSASVVLATLAVAVGVLNVVETGVTAAGLRRPARPAVAATARSFPESLAAQSPSANASPLRRVPSNDVERASKPGGTRPRVPVPRKQPPVEPVMAAVPMLPSQPVPPVPEPSSSVMTAASPSDITAPTLLDVHPVALDADALPSGPALEPGGTPWVVAADAGVAIGQGAQNAGVTTAKFFSRFGKTVARSF